MLLGEVVAWLEGLRRWLRRRRYARLLSSPRVRSVVVGTCRVCGLVFLGVRAPQREVERVLQVHERLCPGGDRRGATITPLG